MGYCSQDGAQGLEEAFCNSRGTRRTLPVPTKETCEHPISLPRPCHVLMPGSGFQARGSEAGSVTFGWHIPKMFLSNQTL